MWQDILVLRCLLLVASSSHTRHTVGEHGNSERTVLITVNEIAINHGGLPGCHGGNRHCVGFGLARRRCNGIWNKGGEVNQSTLKETNMTTGGTGSITITKRGITKKNKAGVNICHWSLVECGLEGTNQHVAPIRSRSGWKGLSETCFENGVGRRDQVFVRVLEN